MANANKIVLTARGPKNSAAAMLSLCAGSPDPALEAEASVGYDPELELARHLALDLGYTSSWALGALSTEDAAQPARP